MAKETDYEKLNLPSDPKLPAWILTPKEEKLIFQRWRKKAFKQCDELIKVYIRCSNSYQNPWDAMGHCKDFNDAQLACMKEYQQLKYLDIERDILIQEKNAKKQG
ncbi:hypothetical protein PSN45_001414 [Yamadazyma tenuis]|uniref:COX assembly mitochondrial protein n=1 Tax=Candida tenuis (strain ATCC 10573 / BCRC 21748 / CBS 615 / JCM 9827 / NBRC 10315 / NRRL Y-1498 / VKM Y-70) TaxID=590646 RepID=G3BCB8_CANTC|nr:uncharacterized protein CANTEDRAFT_116863 [Yamadazyma tenuis ATCC 10573]EGV60795.1 hypothetical protein CANTEDRAFT_116863 [Yamadazyma tenuis ATCC 10573]WEJ93937.1 hypothetical protein PSN45_001414 [Yamadazyma tenuis]